ncbi:hypothetical protein D187_008717 [Cystobacter fuscus DSM 2262]|uniref:Uncharacterized protein n=1 Tax=Cystobacter fuscus (strain ATCC 25194 / DSM 2262 / NBRC 100088 / M29) TaxID=1242864 RepID=S9QMP0_CYSF2|nr:hypothetical protein [Cystobacter fuscus]EPX62529.1 hypothetical protein D187_008717 [Cystobacter fuscus DSM 2262]
MKAKKPWELSAGLTLDRLLVVARLINGVHEGVARHIEPDKGDLLFGRWVPGTTVYARVAHALISAHKSGKYPWLGIVDPTLQFVGSIADVPFRFYTGEPEAPNRSARKLSVKEQQKQREAFDLNQIMRPDLEWGWRFAVYCDKETGEVTSITLEEVHSTGAYRNAFEIPFKENIAPLAAVEEYLPEGVELPSSQPEEIPAAEETGTEGAEGGITDDESDE